MSLNNMDWKAWVALLICVVILCGIGTSLSAHAETEAPTDMAAVSEKESEPLDDSADSTDVPASAEDGQPEDGIEAPPAESPDNPAAAEPDAPVETPDPSPEPEIPTNQPTAEPTVTPDVPTNTPDVPTNTPTEAPTEPPTEQPTETPTEQPTLPPADLKTLFDVDIKVPSGWRNTSSATVRIKITPVTEQMWHQVRYRLDGEDWHPIKNSDFILFEGYMVIDYDKPLDEENEIYETYFLNLVDDRDLMSVVSEEEIVATPTPQIVYVTPEPTEVPQQAPPIVVEDDNSGMVSMLLLVIGIAAVGGAVFWVVRQKKNSAAQQVPDFEDEYNFEEDENEEE